MNTTNTAIVANQPELTKLAKKANSAAKARQRPSKAKVTVVAQQPIVTTVDTTTEAGAQFAIAAFKAGVVTPMVPKATKANRAVAKKALDEALVAKEAGKGVFGAITGSLSAAEAEQAETDAIKAIAKARKPAKTVVTSTRAANMTQRYSLGAYGGKQGAMYAFIMRCGTLGDTFCRDDAVASIVAKPAHDKLATRAQALDYFAWAARHGLLVVAADQSVPAAPVAAPVKAKGAKKGGKKA